MWTDEELNARMRRGWKGGRAEGTPCGGGSLLENTTHVRARLPGLVREYRIHSVCDAGAGDLHWISYMDWDVEYRAFDLVPRTPSVVGLDITREILPACDLILCRMVLVHLDPERVTRALSLFRQSAPYLLATQITSKNIFDATQDFHPWDLSAEPFDLGAPMESIPDAKSDCWLSLWRLQ